MVSALPLLSPATDKLYELLEGEKVTLPAGAPLEQITLQYGVVL
jgi:phospholipid N-methyltransferase